MPPPPLRPEPTTTPKDKTGSLPGRLDRCLEFLAESKAGDYLTAFAAGIKAFREARRKREGAEIPREP